MPIILNRMFSRFPLNRVNGYQFTLLLALLWSGQSSYSNAYSPQALENFIQTAIAKDPINKSFDHAKQKSLADVTLAKQWQDPKLQWSLANVPADSLSTSEDPMTQWRIGLTQEIPNYAEQSNQQKIASLQSQMYPFYQAEHRAALRRDISQLWFSLFEVHQTIKLYEKNRALLEQLLAVQEASYASTETSDRQQALIQAELELSHTNDQLLELAQSKAELIAQFGYWQSPSVLDTLMNTLEESTTDFNLVSISELNVGAPDFLQHPTLLVLQKKIELSQQQAELTKAKNKTNWGVTASFSHRAEDRSDLFSVGLTAQLPFQRSRYLATEVQAIREGTQVLALQRQEKLRQFQTQFHRLNKKFELGLIRLEHYNQTLLAQHHQKTETALSAYTHNDSSIALVLKAHVHQLDMKINSLKQLMQQYRIQAEIQYLATEHQSEH